MIKRVACLILDYCYCSRKHFWCSNFLLSFTITIIVIITTALAELSWFLLLLSFSYNYYHYYCYHGITSIQMYKITLHQNIPIPSPNPANRNEEHIF